MGKKLKVYYAHCMSIYYSNQEDRDISTLVSMGFDVLNPNSEYHSNLFEEFKLTPRGKREPMAYFTELVESCDGIAFRGIPCGRITSGVFVEVKAAIDAGLFVIELPNGIVSRGMTYEETIEYLNDIGER